MTEAEWLNGWHYRRMYEVIRHRVTTRKVRLYMVACCRLTATTFFDPRIPSALETAERCADDPEAEAAADGIGFELATGLQPQLPSAGREGSLARCITDVGRLLDEYWTGLPYSDARQAIAHAAYMCLRHHPLDIFTGGEGDAAEYCARAVEAAAVLQMGARPEETEQEDPQTKTEIRQALADVVRDIFGNPFRSVSVDASCLRWNDGVVPKLARTIYEERAFDRLPVLADALEEAGCANPNILGHCRGPGPHARGCWAVDLILGKE